MPLLSLSPSLLPKKTALKKRRGKKTSAILRQFCRIRADSFSSDASFFHAVFNPHISLDGRLITLTDHNAFRFSRQQFPSANVKRKKNSPKPTKLRVNRVSSGIILAVSECSVLLEQKKPQIVCAGKLDRRAHVHSDSDQVFVLCNFFLHIISN